MITAIFPEEWVKEYEVAVFDVNKEYEPMFARKGGEIQLENKRHKKEDTNIIHYSLCSS